MERFFEFISHHWLLSSIWLTFLGLLLWHNKTRSGQWVTVHMLTRLVNKNNARVVDLRSKKEFNQGHILNAISIPYDELSNKMSTVIVKKDSPIVLVCKVGQTVSLASKSFKGQGHEVYQLKGGVQEWRHQGLPLVS